MASAAHTVFVTGATGTQGGFVARKLRSIGWDVHAIVRDPSSPAAQALAALGVEITPGDWDDEAALRAAIRGCTKVFLVMTPPFHDISIELVQAKRIVALAKETGAVDHFVYSSGVFVDSYEKLDGLAPTSLVAQSFASKRGIETAVRAAGFPTWTILRGALFMANFLSPKVMMYPGLVETNRWTVAFRPDTQLPLIDAEDIAAIAIAAFQNPAQFASQEVTLAGEILTPDEIMARLSRATGRDLKVEYMSDDEVAVQKAVNPFIEGQLIMKEMIRFVDLEESKSWGVPMGTFEEFLEREKRAVKETFP